MANVATTEFIRENGQKYRPNIDDTSPETRASALARNAKTDDEKSSEHQQKRRERLIEQSISAVGYKHFILDVWLLDLNPTEFGLFKRSRNRAKSRQFTQDMDIYAEVIEEGERTGLIGYRKSLWKNEDGARRLVFKMFSDKLNWRASMDLMLARSVQQTIGARLLPVMTYSVNFANEEQLVSIERSSNKWPLMPENFSFFLLQDGRPEFYRIRQDFFRFGDDYSIYNAQNKRIGRLDGAFFSISGKWRCRIREEYASRQLLDVLKMFAGMLIFNDQCRSHVKFLARQVMQGKGVPNLERQEIDLYANPRRLN
ncbi:MAG: hypothetical protein AAFW82_09965 [Pseudomonadota bacterium]